MLKQIVKWVLKMVDVSISLEDGLLRIVVEFAGTVIVDHSIPVHGVTKVLHWDASPKGVL